MIAETPSKINKIPFNIYSDSSDKNNFIKKITKIDEPHKISKRFKNKLINLVNGRTLFPRFYLE